MGFLHPWFLLLSLAVIIPIAIHLFNFHRFKQVLFTNVKFLQNIAIENKKQNKLLERLLLLVRCLAIIFISLLFAQPYIKNPDNRLAKDGGNAVVLIVDNSFSMQNISSMGSLLENAKLNAQEILDEYSDNDVFCLITTDLEGKHKHFVTKNTITEFLKDIEISSSSRHYSELINTAHHLLSLRNEESKRVFFISDYQKTNFDIANIKQDSLIKDVFLPLEINNINNVYVDSLSIGKNIFLKGQKVDLKIHITNASEQDIEKQTVKLFIDDKQQSIATCDIKANSSIEIPMSFVLKKSGTIRGKIHIIDNPVVYDDDFFFTIDAGEKIKALCINGKSENKYLNKLFANSSEVEMTNMSQNAIDFAEFTKHSVIILNELNDISSGLANELKNFRQKGANIVIIPSENIDITSYNAAMQTLNLPIWERVIAKNVKVKTIDANNKLFKNFFSQTTDNMEMPQVKKYYKISTSSSAKQDILTLANNDAFFVESSKNGSDVFLFATPLNDKWTDFVSQSIFVPIMWNMVLYSTVLPPSFVAMNSNEFIDISILDTDKKAEYIKLKNKENNSEIIPQMQAIGNRYGFFLHNQIKHAGFYDIVSNNKTIGCIAMNYPRLESNLTFMNASEINKELKKTGYDNYSVFNDKKMITSYFAQSDKGFDFTTWLLVLIILASGTESFIIYKLKSK